MLDDVRFSNIFGSQPSTLIPDNYHAFYLHHILFLHIQLYCCFTFASFMLCLTASNVLSLTVLIQSLAIDSS